MQECGEYEAGDRLVRVRRLGGRDRRAQSAACRRECRTRQDGVRRAFRLLDFSRERVRRRTAPASVGHGHAPLRRRRGVDTAPVSARRAVRSRTRPPARARRRGPTDHDGAEVDWAGDGAFLAFARARDAVAAAAQIQRVLATEPWPATALTGCESASTRASPSSATRATWGWTS